MASGTTIAQLISIGTAPIVYRLYEKVDYGTLGLYMAITGVLGVFSTFQYSQTILLEKEDEDSRAAMWLNRFVNTMFTILVFLFVLVFKNYIGGWANNELITPWLFMAPISIFFAGQNEIFRVWANRKKEYKLLTLNSIVIAVTVPIFSIGIGLIHDGPLGLFIGLLSSQLIPAIVLLLGLRSKYNLGYKGLTISRIVLLAKENVNFPLYTLPSEFINRFTNQLPVFMLSRFVGPSAVALYNLSSRMLGLPISLISNAISEVFRQRAAHDYNEHGNCRPIFLKTFKTLALVSIIPALVIVFFGPELFAFFFGEKWREAGVYSQILIVLFTARMVVSPLTYMYFVAQRQREDFIWHIWMLISNFCIFYGLLSNGYEALTVIWGFVINYTIIYGVYGIRSYIFATGKR